MSLQVEKLEKNMAKLTIEVSAEDLDKAMEKAHIFFPLSAAPCNASNTALRKPFFSRIRTPSMVVPAGEQ